MPDVILKFWEFDEAPAKLRSLFPDKFAGEWLALVRPDQTAAFVSDLIVYWNCAGLRVAQSQASDGGIVLAGAHGPAGAPLG